MDIDIKETELYQELDLFYHGEKIGEAEVSLNNKMISRLTIYPPYQNLGFGTQIVNYLNNKYNCNCLWVNADNYRAIHVYEKNGYQKIEPTVYLMRCKNS